MLTPFQKEVASLIVETLNLEITVDSIDADDALFGEEGLALDSIDALELAFAIGKKYQVEIKSDDENNQQIFASLRSLAAYVENECSAAPS